MATINQLKTRIASAEAKVAKFNELIAKYTERFEKNLAILKTSAHYSDEVVYVQRPNWRGVMETEINYYHIAEVMTDVKNVLKVASALDSAYDGRRDNQKKLDMEIKNIASLKDELAHAQAKAEKEASEYDDDLEMILTDKTAEDKKKFIENAIESAAHRYDTADEMIAKALQMQDEAKAEGGFYWNTYKYEKGMKIEAQYRSIKRKERSAYIEREGRDAEDYYNVSIKNMVMKLAKFAINKYEMQITFPQAVGTGLEMMITDNQNRVIDARIIWAATYSEIVSEHIRFIVTERKGK